MIEGDIDTIQRTLDTILMQLDQQVQLKQTKKPDEMNNNIFAEIKSDHNKQEDDHLQ